MRNGTYTQRKGRHPKWNICLSLLPLPYATNFNPATAIITMAMHKIRILSFASP